MEELRGRIAQNEPLFLIDVRTCSEFASGHVPGAISIPMDEAEARIGDIPEGLDVVLICHSGDRAAIACKLIREQRPRSLVLQGGTEGWIKAGLPVIRSQRTRWAIDRQVRLIAGLIVLAGTLLSLFVAPGWIYVAMFIGAGLTFSGITNFCGMASLLALAPWNKPPKSTRAEVSIGAAAP